MCHNCSQVKVGVKPNECWECMALACNRCTGDQVMSLLEAKAAPDPNITSLFLTVKKKRKEKWRGKLIVKGE